MDNDNEFMGFKNPNIRLMLLIPDGETAYILDRDHLATENRVFDLQVFRDAAA